MPPLKKGKKNVGYNIAELTKNNSKGRSRKQIIAIAESAAGNSKKSKKKKH